MDGFLAYTQGTGKLQPLLLGNQLTRQEYNMALLGALVNGGHTVIDHELLTHEDGKRVAAFGWYAGGQLLF